MEGNARTETVRRARAQDWRLTLVLLGFGFALSVMVIVTFAVQNHAQVSARSAILSELSRMRGAYRVRLNDRDVDEGALLVASIRRMRSVPGHHSGPTAPVHVEIRDGERSMNFVIARDSERQDEYWVFRSGKNLQGDPLGQEAGRVLDTELSRYLHRWGFD
jgi:hypothetical protein